MKAASFRELRTLDDFDWSVRLTPQAIEVRFWRAKIRLRRGEFLQAREDLDHFLKEAPDHPLAAEASEMIEKLK